MYLSFNAFLSIERLRGAAFPFCGTCAPQALSGWCQMLHKSPMAFQLFDTFRKLLAQRGLQCSAGLPLPACQPYPTLFWAFCPLGVI